MIEEGPVKSAHIGRIDKAGGVKRPLRGDPQQGMNFMPFHLIHAAGREGWGDRGRGCRSSDETRPGHRQSLEPVLAVPGFRVVA